MKNRLFTIVFGLATLIGIFLISCESDLESRTNIASEKQQQNSNFNLREVTLEEISTKFNPIKEKFKLGKHLKSKKDAFVTTQFRTGDDSEIIIYTDNIKEITQNDYTSYTMYMQIPGSLPNNFYNITIEEQNGETSLFVTKYTTTNNWLENQTQPFEGEITTFRLEGGTSSSTNEFLDADTIDDLMGGGGGGSTGTSSGTTTSNTYPWDCNGTVHTTIFIEPYQCGCNPHHWPWETCDCSNQPGFNTVYQYECIPNDDGSTAGGSSSGGDNTGGAPGGGSSTPSDGNGDGSTSTSLTVIVGSEQECIASPADLNNDCAVDYDEAQFYTFYTGLTPQQQVVVDANQRRFFTYLKGNGFSVEAENFLIELIDYLIANPNVSIEQYLNWFTFPNEGQDFFFNEDFWNDPSLSITPQNLPTWDDFYNAYPRNADGTYMIGADNVYGHVGGDVFQARLDYPIETANTCALKVSIALNGSGIVIPNIPNQTLEGGGVFTGQYFFLNAKALNEWMRLTFGTSEATATTVNYNHYHYTTTNDFTSDILVSPKKGIYSLVFPNNYSASGHADILSEDGTCAAGCYLNYTVSYIDVWVLD